MKENYQKEDMMLCFVQGFECERETNNNYDNNQQTNGKKQTKKVSLLLEDNAIGLSKSSSGEFLKRFPDVKRSLSDRFSIIGDVGGRKRDGNKRMIAIRKTRSTGNFVGAGGGASGGGGGGGEPPRSAPATPLQPAQHPGSRNTLHPSAAGALPVKPDKNAVKQLSSSVPSVQARGAAGGGGGAAGGAGSGDSGESKPPSKARQKKFLRNFPQVCPDERVLNYYSCALVGDILLQGHLYITKNYFAFYSNVFGYVTKLLIPTASVLRVSKEKMARIIPNAVGVCTHDERHVFGSLLSRDSTYKLMLHVWKAASSATALAPPPPEELHLSPELEASEYSPESDTSSGGAESCGPLSLHARCPRRAGCDDAIITAVKSPAVIQPSLLLSGTAAAAGAGGGGDGGGGGGALATLLLVLAICLAASALILGRALYVQKTTGFTQEEMLRLHGGDMYGTLLAWQARLHEQGAAEVHGFLANNLHMLAKVRQSLEALSTIILADEAGKYPHPEMLNLEQPDSADTTHQAGVS